MKKSLLLGCIEAGFISVIVFFIVLALAYTVVSCNIKTSSDPIPEIETIVMRSTPPPPVAGIESRTTASGNYTLAFSFTDTVSGCMTTVNAKRLGNESGRSFWVSMYTAQGTWVQVGYKNSGNPVIEYYYGPGLSEVTVVGQSPITMNKIQTFHIYHKGGGYWRVGRNGVDIIQFYEGSTYGRNVRTGIEYYGSNQKFPELNCPKAIEVMINGVWQIPHASYITHCGRWGVIGDEQDNSLVHGQLKFGPYPPLPLNTWVFKDF